MRIVLNSHRSDVRYSDRLEDDLIYGDGTLDPAPRAGKAERSLRFRPRNLG